MLLAEERGAWERQTVAGAEGLERRVAGWAAPLPGPQNWFAAAASAREVQAVGHSASLVLAVWVRVAGAAI